MDLHPFNFEALQKKLEQLPPFHRVAFAASCCERLLPNYNAFSQKEAWGNPSTLRIALDEIWQILNGAPVDVETINELKQACESEDVMPHEDFCGAGYSFEGMEAANAICYTLEACLDPTPDLIVRIANCVSETLDYFVGGKDEYASFRDITWNQQVRDEYQNQIASHPFMIREMTKQSEDLKRLEESETLDKNLLNWLQTSFDNGGKSLIDLS